MKLSIRQDQSGNTIVHVLVAVLVVAAIGFTGWRVVEHKKSTPIVSESRTSSTVSGSNSPSATNSTATVVLPAGTDNASLSADLNDANNSLNAESQSYSSSNMAINDQQSEIQVPTN